MCRSWSGKFTASRTKSCRTAEESRTSTIREVHTQLRCYIYNQRGTYTTREVYIQLGVYIYSEGGTFTARGEHTMLGMYMHNQRGTYTTMYDDPTPPPEVPSFTTKTSIKIDNVRLNDVQYILRGKRSAHPQYDPSKSAPEKL